MTPEERAAYEAKNKPPPPTNSADFQAKLAMLN